MREDVLPGVRLTINNLKEGRSVNCLLCDGSQPLDPTVCVRGGWLGETLVDPGALLLALFLKSLNYAGFHR